jgi:hypothetical protein
MPKNVYELTGLISRNVVVDDELVFPNVQTCIAVVAVIGGQLVGAHVTLGDRGRLSEVADEIQKRGTPTDVYVVGPILPTYNVNSFANFGGQIHICDTQGFIDVRAVRTGGGVDFYSRDTGSATWMPIHHSSFLS